MDAGSSQGPAQRSIRDGYAVSPVVWLPEGQRHPSGQEVWAVLGEQALKD